MSDIPPNLRPGAFRGAAETYATYRPPYPPTLLAGLLERTGIGPGDVLVDLATGPGRIALDLASSFDRVIAIDVEQEMIEVAKRRAAERGIENIRWHVGRGEELDLPTDSIALVTIGEAFHRLDQRVVARNVVRWLRPGGALAVMGTFGHFLGAADWEVALREVRDRWLSRTFPSGYGVSVPGAAEGPAARQALLREMGFTEVGSHVFEAQITWTLDGLVGYLASTSTCSAAVLGDDEQAWSAELRAAMGATGRSEFEETVEWEYLFARKPTSA